jgi:hypothetical protein
MAKSEHAQRGFAHIALILLLTAVLIVAAVGAFKAKGDHSRSSVPTPKTAATISPTPTPSPEVSWHRGEGGAWVSTGTPPACPDPVLATPVDLSLVTSILYPGQVRGNAFKPHGGFRFDHQPNNDIAVTVPMDAQLLRGSKGLFEENGEVQYGFEFMAPCGIWYSFGHIHTLSPQFQAYAAKLPLISDHSQQQLYDIEGSPMVKKGDVIATQVGIVKTKNVFVELAVLNVQHKNGFTIRPEWAKYANEFDKYAVCWLDLLAPADQARAKALPGGDSVSGKKSDYCK